MLNWLSRQRHSRGFGIHSPFAFRFITEVVGERLPYYDYDVVPGRRPRLLYRLGCYFQPVTVTALDHADIAPVLLACPRAAESDQGQMVVAGAGCDPEALRQAVRRRAVVVIIGRYASALEAVCAELQAMECGMTFSNRRNMAIIVPWQRLPRQDFKVAF